MLIKDWLLTLFNSLPDNSKTAFIAGSVTLFGALVTAAVTIFAVALTNWGHSRRLRIQLENDNESRRKERELTLRKEIYLNAIATMDKAIGSLADTSKDQSQVEEEATARTAAVSKMTLLSGSKLLHALYHFDAELEGENIRFIFRRKAIVVRKKELTDAHDKLHKKIDDGTQELARLNVEAVSKRIKECAGEGIAEQKELTELTELFTRAKVKLKQIDTEIKQLDQARQANLYDQVDLFLDAMKASYKLARLLAPVVVAAREELSLPIDAIEFGRLLQDREARLSEIAQDAATTLRKDIEAIHPPNV